ncbi:MAG TPA: oxidoreductase [Rickettsiales bacterium]|nr:oxidoreductase [Rickettsiales bacterium]
MSKVWFITGCSSGFGKILTQELLKSGERVVATARKVEALSHLQDINDANLLTLPLDVTKRDTISEAVKRAHDHFGAIDVLVNNAGYGIMSALEEASPAAIERVFATNVFGLIAVTQAVLPIMRKQRSGRIINISSAAGAVVTPGFSIYNATKFSVEGASEALAQEVAPFGIKVIIIEPGPFRTDFLGRSLDVMPPIQDYEQSVGPTRQYAEKNNAQQAGDPLKAAHIIMQMAESPAPPLRMPLGNSAVDRIKNKLSNWQKELLEHEELSRSADF